MNARKPKATRSAKSADDSATGTPTGMTAAKGDAGGELERHARIAETAYYMAMARGFAPGQEVDDWLSAERAMDRQQGAPTA